MTTHEDYFTADPSMTEAEALRRLAAVAGLPAWQIDNAVLDATASLEGEIPKGDFADHKWTEEEAERTTKALTRSFNIIVTDDETSLLFRLGGVKDPDRGCRGNPHDDATYCEVFAVKNDGTSKGQGLVYTNQYTDRDGEPLPPYVPPPFVPETIEVPVYQFSVTWHEMRWFGGDQKFELPRGTYYCRGGETKWNCNSARGVLWERINPSVDGKTYFMRKVNEDELWEELIDRVIDSR